MFFQIKHKNIIYQCNMKSVDVLMCYDFVGDMEFESTQLAIGLYEIPSNHAI